MTEHPIRIVLGKVGLDMHDVGVKFVARGLREAGMEVIYLGPFQTADSLVGAATTEDPDVVAISNASGEYMAYVPELLSMLRKQGLSPLVVIGGLVPENDRETLLGLGVDAVFGPGSNIAEIADYLRRAVSERPRAGSQ